MLKNYFFFFLLSTLSINAQISRCLISGPSNISIGESANFSVSSNLAQCSDCYDWDVPSGLSIIGSDQNNSVTLSASQAGTYTIVVNYINENGCNSCTKIINVPEDCPPYGVQNGLIGEYYCSGSLSGTGFVSLNPAVLPNLDQVSQVVWTITGGFNGVSFTNGLQQVTTFNSPFSADITFPSPCGFFIEFNARIIFANGCPDQNIPLKITGSNSKSKIEIYPNPTKSQLNFKFNNMENRNLEIKISDILTGREIHHSRVENNNSLLFKKQIDVTEISNNKFILVQVFDSGKIIESKRILLE